MDLELFNMILIIVLTVLNIVAFVGLICSLRTIINGIKKNQHLNK